MFPPSGNELPRDRLFHFCRLPRRRHHKRQLERRFNCTADRASDFAALRLAECVNYAICSTSSEILLKRDLLYFQDLGSLLIVDRVGHVTLKTPFGDLLSETSRSFLLGCVSQTYLAQDQNCVLTGAEADKLLYVEKDERNPHEPRHIGFCPSEGKVK